MIGKWLLIFVSFFQISYAYAGHKVNGGRNSKACEQLLMWDYPTSFVQLDRLGTYFRRNPGEAYYTNAAVEKFYREGLTYLKQVADENETTIYDLMQDYFELGDLTVYASEWISDRRKAKVVDIQNRALSEFIGIEHLLTRNSLRAPHWAKLRRISTAINLLAILAMNLETVARDVPSFHPYAVIDKNFLEALFKSLDSSALERVKLYEIKTRERGERRDFQRLLREEARQMNLERAGQTSSEPVEELLSEPVGAEASDDSPIVQDDNLVNVLLGGVQLESDHVYGASTLYGRQLEVSVSKSIVKDYASSAREPIYKLLKSIVTGRGDSAGIKTLFDIGPNIIELKAYMNGHKRIFGCLEGSKLRLIRFREIKAKRATYSRLIPKTLCAQKNEEAALLDE